MKRLGFGARIASLLDPEDSLPAVGQGALALECRADRPDVIAALRPLADRDTTLATTAERAVLAGACGELPHAARRARGRSGTASCGCAGCSRAATAPKSCAASAARLFDDLRAADALGHALADEFLARGAARLVAA